MNDEQKKQFLDMDLYKLFEVDEASTIEEIKKAYRKRALESHPDKNLDNKEEAERKFVQLGKAFEVLADKSSKAAYDAVRKARRDKAKRDEHLDEKRKKLKDALEQREKCFKEQFQKKTEAMNRTGEEERYQNEVERLRNEGSKILEEEMNFINEQIRLEKKRASSSKHEATADSSTDVKSPRFKINWPSKLNAAKLNEELLNYLFSKYGQVEALVVSKKASAILEYRNLADAMKCLDDERFLKDTYSLTIKWLGPELNKSKPHQAESANLTCLNNEQFTDNFEEIEMAILKKMRQAANAAN